MHLRRNRDPRNRHEPACACHETMGPAGTAQSPPPLPRVLGREHRDAVLVCSSTGISVAVVSGSGAGGGVRRRRATTVSRMTANAPDGRSTSESIATAASSALRRASMRHTIVRQGWSRPAARNRSVTSADRSARTTHTRLSERAGHDAGRGGVACWSPVISAASSASRRAPAQIERHVCPGRRMASASGGPCDPRRLRDGTSRRRGTPSDRAQTQARLRHLRGDEQGDRLVGLQRQEEQLGSQSGRAVGPQPEG